MLTPIETESGKVVHTCLDDNCGLDHCKICGACLPHGGVECLRCIHASIDERNEIAEAVKAWWDENFYV